MVIVNRLKQFKIPILNLINPNLIIYVWIENKIKNIHTIQLRYFFTNINDNINYN